MDSARAMASQLYAPRTPSPCTYAGTAAAMTIIMGQGSIVHRQISTDNHQGRRAARRVVVEAAGDMMSI